MIFYPNIELEELAAIGGMDVVLKEAVPLLSSAMRSISFETTEGHRWVLERKHGLVAVSLVCSTPEHPHSNACVDPGEMSEDNAAFMDDFFGGDK